ncbi:hypothetical protein TNCV_4395281 [Trichonephila clavipes]|uniref:Uncharacterized protein n=1 Tax=Trichonephila clavipes TaxID=2585209 RepID=A0A8X6W4W1_TRICX|nr:hypothetical protein TNCV_4395281 [Trichonephila clavipes]
MFELVVPIRIHFFVPSSASWAGSTVREYYGRLALSGKAIRILKIRNMHHPIASTTLPQAVRSSENRGVLSCVRNCSETTESSAPESTKALTILTATDTKFLTSLAAVSTGGFSFIAALPPTQVASLSFPHWS